MVGSGVAVALAWGLLQPKPAQAQRAQQWLLEVNSPLLTTTITVNEGAAFTVGETRCEVAKVTGDRVGAWTHLKCGDAYMEMNCLYGRPGTVTYSRFSFQGASATLLCSN